MCWKYWIMMDYAKTKRLLDENQFIDINWLTLGDLLISTHLTRWFDLFNHNPQEQKHCRRTWLIRAQALQILWDSVHILMHALNNFCRPYGRQLWQATLRKTKVKLQLLTDINMLLLVERIRGETCHSIYQFAEANNYGCHSYSNCNS